MLKRRDVRAYVLLATIACSVLIASCHSHWYDPETGEMVFETYWRGSYEVERTKMTYEEYEKWVNENSSFLFHRDGTQMGVDTAEATDVMFYLVFEDEHGQQTGEFYSLTGTAEMVGDQLVSTNMTNAPTALGPPVTATFALTPTNIRNGVAQGSEGTLNVTLPEGTYTGDIELTRLPNQ